MIFFEEIINYINKHLFFLVQKDVDLLEVDEELDIEIDRYLASYIRNNKEILDI